MKASELLAEMQKRIDKYGDVEIDGSSYLLNILDVLCRPTNQPCYGQVGGIVYGHKDGSTTFVPATNG